MSENMERKIEINIYDGGQLNIASDNACIEAQQNTWMEFDKEIVHSFLDVVNGEECIHEVFENGEERYKVASERDVENFPDNVIDWYKYETR